MTPESQLLDLWPVEFYRLVAVVSGVNIAKDHSASKKWHTVRFAVIATVKQANNFRAGNTYSNARVKKEPIVLDLYRVERRPNMRFISEIKGGKWKENSGDGWLP